VRRAYAALHYVNKEAANDDKLSFFLSCLLQDEGFRSFSLARHRRSSAVPFSSSFVSKFLCLLWTLSTSILGVGFGKVWRWMEGGGNGGRGNERLTYDDVTTMLFSGTPITKHCSRNIIVCMTDCLLQLLLLSFLPEHLSFVAIALLLLNMENVVVVEEEVQYEGHVRA
jgi:hypothetical protein